MLIAQITDCHLRADGVPLHGRVDTAAALAAAVAQIRALDPAPDAIVVTGDIADQGLAEDYAAIRSLLDPLPAPTFVIPGNHDDRAELGEAFGDWGYLPRDREFLHYTVERFPLRLIGLDTVIPGEVGGGLCAQRLAWLAERLAEQPRRPTVIFMHHPPFATGIRFMDRPPFEGGEALRTLILGHRQVQAIVCGHVHRAVQTTWAGTLAAIAPSTAYQMPLAFHADDRYRYIADPAAIALYLWEEIDGLRGFQMLVATPAPAAGGRGR